MMKNTIAGCIACLVFGLCSVAASAAALGTNPLYIEGGTTDCGDWLAARSENRSVAFEHYVIGELNGLSMGTDIEFWRADGRQLSRDAVYYWLDNYCHTHPTDMIVPAVFELFKDRSGFGLNRQRLRQGG
jgi:hypothetical protein